MHNPFSIGGLQYRHLRVNLNLPTAHPYQFVFSQDLCTNISCPSHICWLRVKLLRKEKTYTCRTRCPFPNGTALIPARDTSSLSLSSTGDMEFSITSGIKPRSL